MGEPPRPQVFSGSRGVPSRALGGRARTTSPEVFLLSVRRGTAHLHRSRFCLDRSSDYSCHRCAAVQVYSEPRRCDRDQAANYVAASSWHPCHSSAPVNGGSLQTYLQQHSTTRGSTKQDYCMKNAKREHTVWPISDVCRTPLTMVPHILDGRCVQASANSLI